MKKLLSLGLINLISFNIYADSWRPMDKTCAELGNTSAEFHLKKPVHEIEAMSDQEALNYVDYMIGKTLYSSFLFFNSPSIFIADKVVRLNLLWYLKENCKIVPTDNSLSNLVKETRQCAKTYFSTLIREHYSYTDLQHLFKGPNMNNLNTVMVVQDILKEKLKALPIGQALNNIIGPIAVMAPAAGSTDLITHEVLKMSVSPELSKLSEKLFFHQLNLIEDAAVTGKVKGKDVFVDLFQFFKNEGFTDEEARKLSFYYLGTFSTRGASIIFNFASSLHPYSFSALLGLSLSISYLDKVAFKANRNYIIPHEYSSKCQIGKPYHFWMAAYQANYMQFHGTSPTTANLLPVLGGIAYDFTTSYNGRSIQKLFSIKTPYDDYANATRVDNWVRSLGAHFGRHRGKVGPLNADELLEKTFERGQMPRKIPVKPEEMVEEYLRIVQPVPMILRLTL